MEKINDKIWYNHDYSYMNMAKQKKGESTKQIIDDANINYPANIRVFVQRRQNDVGLASFCSLALRLSNVGASRKKHTKAQRSASVGDIAVGFQHYADGKPSVHSIGCNDSTNNLLNIYLISPDKS